MGAILRRKKKRVFDKVSAARQLHHEVFGEAGGRLVSSHPLNRWVFLHWGWDRVP